MSCVSAVVLAATSDQASGNGSMAYVTKMMNRMYHTMCVSWSSLTCSLPNPANADEE